MTSDQPHAFVFRFAFVYAALAAVLAIALIGVALAFTLPPKHTITRAELHAAIQDSDQALVAAAEKAAATSAGNAGVTLTAQRLVKVTHNKNGTATVVLNVDAGPGAHYKVTVTLDKSIWTPTGLDVQQT